MTGLGDAVVTFGTTGDDELTGDSRDDVIQGDAGNDQLNGGEGDDTLIGGSGNDVLIGGRGSDVLYGGAGADVLAYTFADDGGALLDRLFGGTGADTLVLNFEVDEYTTDVAAEVAAYAADLAAGRDPGNGGECVFESFALRASGFETVLVFVGGLPFDPANPPGGIAVDDAFSGVDNDQVTGNVVSNDFTSNGSVVELVEDVSGGELTLLAGGQFSYDPGDAFRALSVGETATVTFTYAIVTGTERSEAEVAITLAGVNEAPTASDIFAATDQDTAQTLNVLVEAAPEDVDASDVLVVSAVEGVAVATGGTTVTLLSGAVVTVGPDGALIYDPAGALNFIPEGDVFDDEVAITIADGQGGTVTITLNLSVDGLNDAPETAADVIATDEETPVIADLLDNDVDVDGDVLALVAVGSGNPDQPNVERGGFAEVVLANDAGGFADAAGALGADDGAGGALASGQALDVAFLSVAAVDGTAEGLPADDIIVHGVGTGSAEVFVSADGMTFTRLGTANAAGQNRFDLADISFAGPVRVVQVVADSGAGFTLDAVEITSAGGRGTLGTVVQQGGGVVSYDPAQRFETLSVGASATEAFAYVTEDPGGQRALGVATVTIDGVNDAPTGAGVNLLTDSATPIAGNLLSLSGAADVDRDDILFVSSIDGTALPGGVGSVTLASGAVLTVDADGSFTYDPNGAFDPLAEGEIGDDTITFVIADGQGGSFTETIDIAVDGINDPPLAVDDSFTTDQNTPILLDVLDNDSDPDGLLGLGSLVGIDDTGANGGSFTIGQGGLINFEPGGDFDDLAIGETRDTSITYTIRDDQGAEATATATVTVEGLNDNPTGGGIFENIDEDDVLSGNLITLGGITDIDTSDVLSVSEVNGTVIGPGAEVITLGSGVVLTVSRDGTFTYDTAAGFDNLADGDTGFDDFTITVVDGNGGSTSVFNSLTINGLNDAPLADPFTVSADEDNATSGDFSGDLNARDPDDGAVVQLFEVDGQSLITDPSVTIFLTDGGRLDINADQTFAFDPLGAYEFLAEGEVLTEDVTITVVDDQGAVSAPQVLTVEITGINDAPEVGSLIADTTNAAQNFLFNLLTDQVDPDNGAVLSAQNLVTVTDGFGAVLDGNNFSLDATALNFLATGEEITLSFTYDVVDEFGAAVENSFDLTVTGDAGGAPTAQDDFFDTFEDDAISGSVADNDDAPGGTYTLDVGVSGGFLDFALDGSFTFDPGFEFDFLGQDDEEFVTFEYTVTNANGSASAIAEIRIFGIDDAPGSFIPGILDVRLVTIDGDGDPGNGDSFAPEISGDGGQVSFTSDAVLAEGDANGREDVFIADADGGNVSRGSIGNNAANTVPGAVAGGGHLSSGAGDFLVFASEADDLGITDTNGVSDVFILDRDAGTTTLVSENLGGAPGNGASDNPSVSANGRFVVYQSEATDLDDLIDDNGTGRDVFLADLLTGEAINISQLQGDPVAAEEAFDPVISANGEVVVFATANSMVAEDTNGLIDIYAYNRLLETFTLVSVADNEDIGNGAASAEAGIDGRISAPSISANGRYVSFVSQADNLVAGDTNGVADVFVRDLLLDTTTRASVNLSGAEADGSSFAPDISGNGRYVTYQSDATNLDVLTPDTNGVTDIYLFDRLLNDTIRVTVTPDQQQQPGGTQPSISDDGSVIAFTSLSATGSYDGRVVTTDVAQVFTTVVELIGFNFTDQDGLQGIDLATFVFDPEDGDLSIDNVTVVSDDSDRIVNFDVIGGGGVPGETSIEIDFDQFGGLGANEFEILTVEYDLSDDNNSSVFTAIIVVEGINDAPVVSDQTFDIARGVETTDSLFAFDPNLDELTFTVLNTAPDGFELNLDGSFSFTPPLDQAGDVDVLVEVSDGNGGFGTISATFFINEPPTFAGLPGTQVAVVGQTAALDVGAAFSDPEGSGLTFAATLVGGGALPGTLAIDAATGVIGGTVAAGDRDFYRIAITATDDIGLAVTGETWLSVVDNVVIGTAAADILTAATEPSFANNSPQLVDGSDGNDSINAGDGADTYLFRFGEGFDSYQDNTGGDADRVVIEGALSTDVVYRRVGADTDDVIVTLASEPDSLTNGFLWVDALLNNISGQIAAIHFDDGVTVTRADIQAQIVAGQIADQVPLIEGGNDTADALSGFDGAVLSGLRQGDSYLYAPGDGRVTILDNGLGAGDSVTIGFALFDPLGGPSDTLPELGVLAEETDLVIDFGGGDVLTVVDAFAVNNENQIETFIFDDGTLDVSEIRQLVVDQRASSGDDVVRGFGANQADVLEGGAGDDLLTGADGSDTYIYRVGDGDDTIRDSGIIDTDVLDVNDFLVVLDAGGLIDPVASEVNFLRIAGFPDDLLITLDDGAGATGSIRINDMLNGGNANVIEVINFITGSGTVSFTADQVRADLLARAPTAADDIITGFQTTQDVIDGGAGDDLLDGGEQSDIYLYNAGDGDDTISDTGLSDTDILRIDGFDLIVDANNVVQPTSQVTFEEAPGSNGDLLIILDNTVESGVIRLDGQLRNDFSRVIEQVEITGPGGTVTFSSADILNQLVVQQISAGNDTVLGSVDDDMIDTGTGDDYASGGNGNDIYRFTAGDGRLTIAENGFGNDTLELTGYDFSDLAFTRVAGLSEANTHVRIAPIAGGGDEIVIRNAFNAGSGNAVEQVIDGSGAVLTGAELVQRIIDGEIASGVERPLIGSNRADVFGASLGVDLILSGGQGNDSYTFAVGDGFDEIVNNGFSGSDTLFLDGFSSADIGSTIRFFTNSAEPDDVRIEFGGGDGLLLRNFGAIETIIFGGDGGSFNAAAFAALVADPANTTVATDIDGAGFIDFISTAANEVLIGGNDGIGPSAVEESDIARFTVGSIGHDVITQGTFGSTDIFINVGPAGNEVLFALNPEDRSDLVITVRAVGNANRFEDETVTIVDWRGAFTKLETVTIISDSTEVLDLDDIGQRIVDGQASAIGDAIFGFGSTFDDVGGRGNEVITGGAGDDALRGFGGTSDATPGATQQDVYRFDIGVGGSGGSGRDLVSDLGFSDSDRIELVSAPGTNSASLANATIRADPDVTGNVVIDFGNDEITLDNLTSLNINARYEEIVFDAGGTQEQILSDEQLLALYVAGQSTAGNDTVLGTGLADILEGGTGNDLLRGFGGPNDAITDPGAQFDLYRFTAGGAAGGGQDVIFDGSFSDLDVIEITSGVAGAASVDNVVLRADPSDGNDLILDFGEDELTIEDILDQGISARYQRITFDLGGANEESFTDEELIDLYVTRQTTAGDDVITGSGVADFLAGGLGDDFLIGGAGNDTYLVNITEGDDTIRDGSNSGDDLLIINSTFAATSINKDLLTGEDLRIEFAAGGSVTVLNAFSNSVNSRIETFQFLDVTFSYDEFRALTLQAELDAGRAVIFGSPQDDVRTQIDIDGDGVPDTGVGELRGTTMNERLVGGNGADLYVYTAGDGGHDVIDDRSNGAGDELLIDGIGIGGVIFGRVPGRPDDILITFAGLEGSITIRGGLNATMANRIETISGVDDSVDPQVDVTLTLDDVRARILAGAVTANDDVVTGIDSNVDDTFTNIGGIGSAGGDDSFSGLSGDDVYTFVNAAGLTQRMFIEDAGRTADNDTVVVAGYDETNVTISRVSAGSDDLLLRFAGVGAEDDLIYVVGGAATGDLTDRIETFIFDGGSYTVDEVITAADGSGMLPPSSPGAPPGGSTGAGGGTGTGGTGSGGTGTGGTGSAGTGSGGSSPPGSAPATVSGDARANFLILTNDDDVVEAGGGADTVRGLGGDDDISGGRGRDKLHGGGGDDTVSGDAGRDKVKGNAGDDLLSGNGGFDTVIGGGGSDTLFGNGGEDTLRGGRGADALDGGNRDDKLKGNGGQDILTGGGGDDLMIGGRGRDTFVFADRFGSDTIRDFADGRDLLDFSGHSAIGGFDDLIITDANGDAVIEDGVGGRIVLENVDRGLIDADDFLF
ncbi:MAG: Ig-like domain-containing protein [Pseudomonadota bacterium]